MTGDALDFTLETLGLADPGLRDRLMQLYLRLDPFPEVPAVLRELRSVGFGRAILSNGTPAMLAAAIDNADRTFVRFLGRRMLLPDDWPVR